MGKGATVTSPQRHLEAEEITVLRSLYPILRRFAAVIGPGEMDPDDLVQEALVKTLRVRRLSELSHPSSYLYRAMYTIAADERRRLGRKRQALSRLGNTQPMPPSYPSDLDELEYLTPRERTVLYLREVEGHSYSEISDLLHVSPGGLRRTATRARRHLREAIIEEADDAPT